GEVMATPIESVLSRLQAVKKTANGWDARCPAHDDQKPSLGIAVTEDGTVLLKCRSQGCTVEAICKAIGLNLADLFPPQYGNGRSGNGLNIVATYDYRDAEGKLVYQVVRLDAKDFRQRRPDPQGKDGWTWNLKGVKRVLYRLPEVRQAVAEGRPVFICEGEKDADNLVRIGFVATTNAGGAGKWSKDYADTLVGAIVIILRDNDDAGRKHRNQVARRLC